MSPGDFRQDVEAARNALAETVEKLDKLDQLLSETKEASAASRRLVNLVRAIFRRLKQEAWEGFNAAFNRFAKAISPHLLERVRRIAVSMNMPPHAVTPAKPASGTGQDRESAADHDAKQAHGKEPPETAYDTTVVADAVQQRLTELVSRARDEPAGAAEECRKALKVKDDGKFCDWWARGTAWRIRKVSGLPPPRPQHTRRSQDDDASAARKRTRKPDPRAAISLELVGEPEDRAQPPGVRARYMRLFLALGGYVLDQGLAQIDDEGKLDLPLLKETAGRNFAAWVLQRFTDVNDQQLATAFGVKRSTVAGWRKQFFDGFLEFLDQHQVDDYLQYLV